MKLTVNGDARQMPAGATVSDLLTAMGVSARGSAVAVGGAVVPRGEWSTWLLNDGDRVELVQAVQGG